MIHGAPRPFTKFVYPAILVIAGVLVYSNSLHNGFFLDDFHYILNNVNLRTVHPIWRHFVDPSTTSSLLAHLHYRPLMPATLSLTWHFFERDPLGYHLFNLCFHLLAAVFAYLLFTRLLRFRGDAPRARATAFLGALVFCLHPISGFAVNYLCGRDNLMAVAFLLISLFFYVGLRRPGASALGWLGALGFLALSLLSKPNAVALPLVVLAFERLIAGTPWRSRHLWLRAGAFFAVVLAFLAVRQVLLAQLEVPLWGTRGDTGLDHRLAYLQTQLKYHLFHYLRNFAWPFAVRALPDVQLKVPLSDPTMWAGAAAVVASLAGAFVLRRRLPVISFAVVSYWLLFALTSSVLLTHQTIADRWMYPSLPFVSLVAAELVHRYLPRRATLGATVIIAAYVGITCHLMNRNYRDEMTLWSHAARYGTTAMGYMNLGRAYIDIDDDKVRHYYEKSLEKFPRAYLTQINLGLWHLGHGENKKGIALVRAGLRNAPPSGEAEARYWLGMALKRVGSLPEAAVQAERAAELHPTNPGYAYEAAVLAENQGRCGEALGHLERLAGIDPDHRNSRFLRAWCLQKLGRVDEAVREYERTLEQYPEHRKSRFNLGYIHMKADRCGEAIRWFERYLELDPGHEGALANIATCRK